MAFWTTYTPAAHSMRASVTFQRYRVRVWMISMTGLDLHRLVETSVVENSDPVRDGEKTARIVIVGPEPSCVVTAGSVSKKTDGPPWATPARSASAKSPRRSG